MFQERKIIAVAGPTASGKSDLAISLAKELGGEIVGCDSMQVYDEMKIGTARIAPHETQGVPHHMLGFQPVDKGFSVSDYVSVAQGVIEDIFKRGAVPIIAGGTGLYMRSLLWGVNFDADGRDDALRLELLEKAESGGIEGLYKQLYQLDPNAAEKIHINNHKRVIRALEYCLVTGKKISLQSVIKSPKYNFYLMCIDFRDRQRLYDRIDRRVDIMMERGLLEEARGFFERDAKTALQAIGYKELFPYFEGEIDLDTATDNIKRETRRYAKRQLTWFRAEKNINFIYADDYENEDELYSEAKRLSEGFLKGKGDKK